MLAEQKERLVDFAPKASKSSSWEYIKKTSPVFLMFNNNFIFIPRLEQLQSVISVALQSLQSFLFSRTKHMIYLTHLDLRTAIKL